MTRLASVADYEREISRLDAVISRLSEQLRQSPDFATEMELYTLEQRRADVQRELRELGDERMPGHEVDLIFNGKPVDHNRLSAAFMGSVLLKVQNLIRTLRAGDTENVGARGRLPQAVLRSAELHFAGSFVGSFGMRLEALDEQFDLEGNAPLAPTLKSFLSLVEAGDDTGELLGRIAEIPSRAAKQYEDLIAELSDNEADLRIIWPNTSGVREASLRAVEASRLLVTLREVREDSHGQYYVGTLDIGNRRHGRFGFLTDEGETFDGIVEDHLIDQLREFYDTRCRAWIETREIRHQRTGAVKLSHRLQELQHVAE